MSTGTSDAKRRRDAQDDYGLPSETKTVSATLRCHDDNRSPFLELRLARRARLQRKLRFPLRLVT